ncbi:acyltransferase [Aquimarina addita]|uniref:Acyltransferase n=1 Tax=Aquimarina addita TaxID=870485 RepID=A0ABP7XF87_9FLAO
MQIQYINNLRAVACYLVVLTHSAMPALDPSFGMFMVLFSIISSPSSELFIMISSSLLAPAKLDMLSFYRKRFDKLLWPFFFWSIVLLVIGYFKNGSSITELITRILQIPLVPATGIYWFIYVIAGLYLIIPIISPWLKNCSKKELGTILLFWGITLLLPFYNVIAEKDLYKMDGDYYFTFVYLGGFIGYLFLGVYLRRYPIIFTSKLKNILFIILTTILGTLPILYAYIINRNAIEPLYDHLSISSVFYVLAIYCFFQNFEIPPYLQKMFNAIAKYSFGIYLIHIIVIRDVIWKLLENFRIPHPIIETPLISIFSLIICFYIVKAITFLPKSKYIIGA